MANYKIFGIGAVTLFFMYIAAMGFLYPYAADDYAFLICRYADIPQTLADFYRNWSIRLSYLIILLLPDKTVFNFLNPFVQILLLSQVFYFIFGHKIDFSSKKDNLSIIALTALMLVAVARPRDTIFWMTGAVCYTWVTLILLFFLNFYRRLLDGNRADFSGKWYLPFFGFLAGMSNENSSLIGIFALATLLLCRRVKAPYAWLGWLGMAAGFTFQMTSPGYRNRYNLAVAEQAKKIDIIGKIPVVTRFAVYASFFALSVLFFVFVCYLVQKRFKPDWNQLILPAAALLTGVLLAGAFAAIPPPAVRAYFSVSLCVIAAAMWTMDLLSLKWQTCFSAALGIGAIFYLGTAVPDFLRIRADEKARLELIAVEKSAGKRNIEVEPHRTMRKKLFQYIFVEDISDDCTFFFNREMAQYYKLDSIKLNRKMKLNLFYNSKMEKQK